MSTTKTWLKRALAMAAVTAAAVVAGDQSASAATATGTFQVRADVFGSCSLAVADLAFPNYTSGQSTADDGATAVTVNCPGATAASPVAAQFQLSVVGGVFQMSSGANTLAYELYQDAGRTTQWVSGTDVPVSIVSNSQDVDVFGRIAANLTPPVGSYAQDVTATLTY
jgi:spore coat protein U domain-containing protein, fimbrial subunit CupE1/2/3/6